MATLTREETEALIQEVLEVYPEKAKKDRAKHLAVNNPEVESKKCVTSNRKSLLGFGNGFINHRTSSKVADKLKNSPEAKAGVNVLHLYLRCISLGTV